MSLAEKCAEWRKRYPARAAELRRLMARIAGVPYSSKLSGETLQHMLEPSEDALLQIIYGLIDDPVVPPTTTPETL